MQEPDALTWRGEHWWVFLLAGIAWLFFAMLVLQFDIDSVEAIGIAAGIVMIVAGVNEFAAAFLIRGWAWLRVLLGFLFVFGGVTALAWPGLTFLSLARILAWFLLFKGTFDIVASLMSRREFELWWLGLISGILELFIAFWAVGYTGRAASLLVLWVGFSALMRGITEVILAFHVKGLKNSPAQVHEMKASA